ncbi:unnamed protein product [Nesidiocoris tenuis]|uniref:Uncharacterized protein n=1 Tax=Nesidiocoris tenuis TaxID=355587 RepID=A0A6H5HEC4_9HEMI|nr:unnamed protein product [Nesidiocoris tenuis]
MGVHIFWPPLAMLVLFIAVVVMLMLRYGSRWCRLRHGPLPEKPDWSDQAYEQRVSFA